MENNLGIQIGGVYKKGKMDTLKSLGWGAVLLIGGIAAVIYVATNNYYWYVTLCALLLPAYGAYMLYSGIMKPIQVTVHEYGVKVKKGSSEKVFPYKDITEVNWYISSSKEGDTTTLTIKSKDNYISLDSDDIQEISSLIQKVEDAHYHEVVKDITVDNIASKKIGFGHVVLDNGYFVAGKKKIALNQFDRYAIDGGQITFFGTDGTKINYSITMAANLKILLHLVNEIISYYKQQHGGIL